MSSTSDISNLFEVAGGSPSQYLEVERTEQIHGSRGRWAMPAEQPELLPAAPVEPAQADAACAADIADPADTVSDAVQPQIACPVPAVASEPSPALPAEPGQPAVSAMPAMPVAVVAGPPPAALSSVFARLLERNEHPADISRRGTP